MKKIILTGGGTAGHVMPNIALLKYLGDFEIHYVGSIAGQERDLIAKYKDQVTYHPIRTGKFRRSKSFKALGQNFCDIFRVIGGYFDAKKVMKTVRPDVIFSKGGFVSVPVALAGKAYKVPVITHESDFTPGLATKIIAKNAVKVLTTFPETVSMIKGGKGIFIGSPVREDLFKGSKEKGKAFLGFADDKKILAVMGGSSGSANVNRAVRENIATLSEMFNIVHMCGKGNAKPELETASYKQYEFIGEELPDVLAATDLIITRGGSNAIHEFATLGIPMLIIPLGTAGSRGDQIVNAESFEKRGMANVLLEENLNSETLLEMVKKTLENASDLSQNSKRQITGNGVKRIYEEIIDTIN